LHELLYHSDCDGELKTKKCLPIAESLEKLLPEIEVDWFLEKTIKFINDLRKCHELNEPMRFS